MLIGQAASHELQRRDREAILTGGIKWGAGRESDRCDDADRQLLAGARPAIRGLLFLGHPLPTFLTAVAGTAFFLMARGEAAVGAGAGLLFVSVYLVLYSIGAMNDYVDEPLDRLACRREKPLVAGDLSRDAALTIWIATALFGFAASYAFNLGLPPPQSFSGCWGSLTTSGPSERASAGFPLPASIRRCRYWDSWLPGSSRRLFC